MVIVILFFLISYNVLNFCNKIIKGKSLSGWIMIRIKMLEKSHIVTSHLRKKCYLDSNGTCKFDL